MDMDRARLARVLIAVIALASMVAAPTAASAPRQGVFAGHTDGGKEVRFNVAVSGSTITVRDFHLDGRLLFSQTAVTADAFDHSHNNHHVTGSFCNVSHGKGVIRVHTNGDTIMHPFHVRMPRITGDFRCP